MIPPPASSREATPPSNLARYLAIGSLALPCILFTLNSKWTLPTFSPKQVIDSNDLFPLVVAPWAGPTSFLSALSRVLQAAFVWRLPLRVRDVAFGYGLWIIVALARTLTGFLLTRSVGWALPRLFSHYALYEMSAGCGPMVVGYLMTLESSELSKIIGTRFRPHYFVVGFPTMLCWLDNEPWTYGIANLAIGVLNLLPSILPRSYSKPRPLELDVIASRRATTLGVIFPLMLLIIVPYNLHGLFVHRPNVSMPDPPFPPSRLLDIVVLSFPRPDAEVAKKIMMTTMGSYLPLLSQNVSLAAFTHAIDHPAFDDVRAAIPTESNVIFYKDTDTHLDAHPGQYLHLAEAFRWQSERGPTQAEWVMLVEDDFPICGRESGLSALRTVMKMLEEGRQDGEPIPARRGAFIGTGGSGLIFHRSLLSILIHILRTHSDISSKLPPGMPRRPADVVLQDCLLGHDPLCPPPKPGGLIITSRLVMDHIGGIYSTNTQKAPNSDKWRCGWRHAFHGRTEVDVVVVDDLW